jgi:hypothetical protein
MTPVISLLVVLSGSGVFPCGGATDAGVNPQGGTIRSVISLVRKASLRRLRTLLRSHYTKCES